MLLKTALILTISFGLSAQRKTTEETEITAPHDDDRVQVRDHVSGTTRSEGRVHVYVLVRSLNWESWWVQPEAIVNRDGKWSTICYFGTPEFGHNERFAVVAIALPTARFKAGEQIASLPDEYPTSKIITVVRN